MINAEEAVLLSRSYRDNYRKQERIALENKVSAEVEKAASQGLYSISMSVDSQDKDYIIEKVQLEGFQVGNIFKLSDNAHYSVEIMWNIGATPKTNAKHLAEEFAKLPEQ